MTYRVQNLWTGDSHDFPDDDALWTWIQLHLPEVMTHVPTDTADLLRHVNTMQNWSAGPLEAPAADAPPPMMDAVLLAAGYLRDGLGPEHRAAHVLFEDDPVGAALAAAGAPVTEANRAALKGLAATQNVEKAEGETHHFEVQRDHSILVHETKKKFKNYGYLRAYYKSKPHIKLVSAKGSGVGGMTKAEGILLPSDPDTYRIVRSTRDGTTVSGPFPVPKHGYVLRKDEQVPEGEHNPKGQFHHRGVPPALAQHPLFGTNSVGMISGEAPRAPSAPGGHEALVGDLKAMGLSHEETEGNYGGRERSIIVHGPTQQQMYDLGRKYGQESVVWGQGGKHRLLYTTGEHAGRYHPSKQLVRYSPTAPDDYYTVLPGHGHVTLYFDFDKMRPSTKEELDVRKAEDDGLFDLEHQGTTYRVMQAHKHGLLVSEVREDGTPLPPEGEVLAAQPEGQATADAVHRAIHAGREEPLHLKGRHAAGSWLIVDPEKGDRWLLKPGSGPQSPSAGARDEAASQSQREAAYYHALAAMGLGAWAPRADLVTVGGVEYAAIAWLGDGWGPIDDAYREDPTGVLHALRPYLQDGTLHRLAAADFVLGDADRHGANILYTPGQPMRLIDHGSALAGDGFDPGHDPNSYAPWYLRILAGDGWTQLSDQERLDALPTLDGRPDALVDAWLMGLDENAIGAALHRYGVNPEPTLDRLARLRDASFGEPVSYVIDQAWTVGLPDREEP